MMRVNRGTIRQIGKTKGAATAAPAGRIAGTQRTHVPSAVVVGQVLDRGQVENSKLGPLPAGVKQVTCWCERTVVRVPLDDIVRGLTGSCGRANCHGPTS